MAAATAVFQALAPGDHVLAPKVMYWSLRNWLMNFATHWGLQVELIDMTDPLPVQAAIGRARRGWCGWRRPANPLWTVTDIAATARHRPCRRRAAGGGLHRGHAGADAAAGLGADIVMHAATKYLNGHSDLIAGVLVARDADEPSGSASASVRAQLGGTLGSFEAWLLLRGMRTLYLRVRAASASAQRIAEHFPAAPAGASEVLYPGCPARRAMPWRARRCKAASAACCRSACAGGEAAAIAVAARHRRSVETRDLAGRHRKPDRAPRQRRRRGHAGRRPTCCGCRWASRTWMT
jgi:cystathionine gamma-synthase